MAQSKNQLIYIGDPMCSWCYGIAPELEKAVNQLDGKIEFQMIMGGLRPYNTQTIAELGDFLKEHWVHIEEKTGQAFNFEILSDQSYLYDTEPPSRAVVIVRKLKPSVAFTFFKAVQTLFYKDNVRLNQASAYLDLIKSLDIDPKAFTEAFESEEYKQLVRNDFEQSTAMGVRGFPTMILKSGEQYHLITNGYTSADEIVSKVERVLSEH